MTQAREPTDLLVLVADRNIEAAIRGLVARRKALGIRELTAEIRRHPRQDGGCLAEGVQYLNPLAATCRHALLIFDREGCGREDCSAAALENDLEGQLRAAGWHDRASVVVLDPELEIWVWSDSPHVDGALGWAGRQPDLRHWLRRQGLLAPGQFKPIRPKEALEAALRIVRLPRSSSIYRALADKVSFKRCTDRAFLKLVDCLQRWFGEVARGEETSECGTHKGPP